MHGETVKKKPWYSFLLEAEWIPGHPKADRRNSSLEGLRGPYRESNPEPPALWRNASTNCITSLNEIII